MVLGSRLQKILKRWIRDGGDLWAALHAEPALRVESARDALVVCGALEHASALLPTKREAQEMLSTPLNVITSLFQEVSTMAASRILAGQGLPKLDDIVQRHLYAERFVPQEDILFIFKVMASYQYAPGVRHLGAALRRGYALDHYLWPVIFAHFAEPGHPGAGALADRIEGAELRGGAETGWLHLANVLAEAEHFERHPFDDPAGRERLRQYLQADREGEGWAQALEATKALAYQAPSEIRPLLELAERHPHPRVRLQALGVRMRRMPQVDRENSVRVLVRHAENPRHSRQACRLLDEAGVLDEVPARVEDPDFRALVDLCEALEEWVPSSTALDQMEVLERRELHWPPGTATRMCSICRFCYTGSEKENQWGVALVHATVTLFVGSALDHLNTDDLFAFFCAYEHVVPASAEEINVPEYVTQGHALLHRHREACGERKTPGRLLAVR